MTDETLTLVIENLSPGSATLNRARLNTIFQLAHVDLPDCSSQLASKEPLIAITFTGAADAMHRVAMLAKEYEESVVVIEGGDSSQQSLVNICTDAEKAKMALWLKAGALKP
jgi:hypothetical protein